MIALPLPVTAFDVQVCSPLSSDVAGRVNTEDSTFAIRHLTWDRGEVSDSGWRCWIDGVFHEHPTDPQGELFEVGA